MSVEIFDWYKRPPKQPEINSGELVTEQAGYVPPRKQIEDMILAGQRLNAARLEQFQSYTVESEEELVPDPTASPGFDLADASSALAAIQARAAAAEAAAAAARAEAEAAAAAAAAAPAPAEPAK